MKKTLYTLTFILLASFASLVTAASDSTPLRFSIWPGIGVWPANMNIYGLSIGLPVSFDSPDTYVAGVDFALGHSKSNVKGLQFGVLVTGKDSDGAQIAIANIVESFNGLEIGVYNEFESSAGVQIGLINRGKSSKGLQIGLINMLDNGFFDTFPFFNFSVK